MKFLELFFVKMIIPQTAWLLGVLTVIVQGGVLDRGAGEVPDRIRRYFRGFVFACSFCMWPRARDFLRNSLRCSFCVVILVLFGVLPHLAQELMSVCRVSRCHWCGEMSWYLYKLILRLWYYFIVWCAMCNGSLHLPKNFFLRTCGQRSSGEMWVMCDVS